MKTPTLFLSRREWLKAGLAGSVLLAAGGWWHTAAAANARGAATHRLADEEREMLGAIAAVILDGSLSVEPAERARSLGRAVDGVAQTVAGLSLATQKEIGELFGLLAAAPGRRLLAGVASPWREASAADVAAFLESWRASRFALLQSAYLALHDLVFGAWYAQIDSWAAIGYPGPPEVFK